MRRLPPGHNDHFYGALVLAAYQYASDRLSEPSAQVGPPQRTARQPGAVAMT